MKSKRDAIKRNSGQITNTNVSLGYGFQFKVNFELADIYLHNRILISSQNSDLWRLGGRWGLKLQTSAWARNVQGDLPQQMYHSQANLSNFFKMGPP